MRGMVGEVVLPDSDDGPAGLTQGSVGLYQFNVVVPAVPDSNRVPITFNLAGGAATQTLYTAVHQ